MLRLQGCRRFKHIDPVDTGLAMDVFRGLERSLHRPVAAGEHRHVADARDIAHHSRVSLRQFERHVAADRRNAKDLEFR